MTIETSQLQEVTRILHVIKNQEEHSDAAVKEVEHTRCPAKEVVHTRHPRKAEKIPSTAIYNHYNQCIG